MENIFRFKPTKKSSTSTSGAVYVTDINFYDKNRNKINGTYTVMSYSNVTSASNLFDGNNTTKTQFKHGNTSSSYNISSNCNVLFKLESDVAPEYFSYTIYNSVDTTYQYPTAFSLYYGEDYTNVLLNTVAETISAGGESKIFEIDIPINRYTIKVVDNYYEDEELIESVVRSEEELEEGTVYSFSALDVEGFVATGSITAEGTATKDEEIIFTYSKRKSFLLTVKDVFYDMQGEKENENIRVAATVFEGEHYSYDALEEEGYIVEGVSHYEGYIEEDTDIEFKYNKDQVYHRIIVNDVYFDLEGQLEKTEKRIDEQLVEGSEYEFKALEIYNYDCVGNKKYTGIADEDKEINFEYNKKIVYFTITVVDEFRTASGKLEKSIIRDRKTLVENTRYEYSALEYEGYISVGEDVFSGVITSDISITFEYIDSTGKKDYYKAGAFNLIGLDKEFNIVCLLSPTNIQWSRKYHESGTFSIQIPLEQYDCKIKYIYTKARPEMGKVSQVNYSVKSGYKYMQLSGFFMEEELNRHVVYDLGTTNITNDPNFYVKSGKAEDVAFAYFEGFRTIKGINTDGTEWESDLNIESGNNMKRGKDATYHRLGEYLGHKIYKILKPSGMSYRIEYDFDSSRRIFTVWEGLDRTYENKQLNNPAIFSTKYGNVKNPNIVIDDSTYKNGCIVSNEYVSGENDSEYTIQAYYEPPDEDGSFCKLDSSQNKSNYDNLREFQIALENEGIVEVNNATKTINLEFDSSVGSYIYFEDFDLGDLCSIEIPEIGFYASARLIGCYEVIKSGDWSLSMEFGTPIIK